jgi:hypothetical protein
VETTLVVQLVNKFPASYGTRNSITWPAIAPCKLKMSLWFIKHYTMNPYGGVEVYLCGLLTYALVGAGWLDSRPRRFTHWLEDWVGPRADLEVTEKRRVS